MGLSSLLLDSFNHGLVASGGRIGITRRIVLGFADSHILDNIVVNVHSEALAASHNSNTGRTRVGHFHVESLGEFPERISHEGDHGALDALIFLPSLHDGGIVHAVHENFVDTGFLESVLILKVTGYLNTGSGWGEGAGQAHDDHVLARGVFRNVNLFGRSEILEESRLRELVSSLDGRKGMSCGCAERSECQGEDFHGCFCFLCSYYGNTAVASALLVESLRTAERKA